MNLRSRRKKYINPNKAKIGDLIEFEDNKQGVVVKILNNTVVVDISYMENYNFHTMGHERQVVHYSEYKVLSQY